MLIFCLLEAAYRVPFPMRMFIPMRLFMSTWTAKDALTHHLIIPASLIDRIRGRCLMSLRYLNVRASLFLLSRSGLRTLGPWTRITFAGEDGLSLTSISPVLSSYGNHTFDCLGVIPLLVHPSVTSHIGRLGLVLPSRSHFSKSQMRCQSVHQCNHTI